MMIAVGTNAQPGLLLLILVGLVTQATSTGTRFVFLREPTAAYLERFLERQDTENAATNHPYAGFTDPAASRGDAAAPPPPPPGFQERTVRVRLGDGKRTYETGRKALLMWRMHEGSSWARIKLGRRLGGKISQPNMVTVAKAFGGLVWCVNPCKVLYERKDERLRFLAPATPEEGYALSSGWSKPSDRVKASKHGGEEQGWLWSGGAPSTAPPWALFSLGRHRTGKQAAVAYATKEGHLIQGEERMRVVWFCGRSGGDDSVWFEVYSVSRGAGCFGGMMFPFIQSMQRRFFREQAETMRRVVDPSRDQTL